MRSALFVSHSAVTGTFRVGSHHLARELARQDVRVVHLSTPRSAVHRVLRRGDLGASVPPARPWTDADGVTHVVPRTVLPVGVGGRVRYADVVRETVGTDRVDVAFLDQPLLWSPALRGVAEVLVYRPTDLYPDGTKARLQDVILEHADAVVATSDEVLDRLGLRRQVPTAVIENGVDLERFDRTGTRDGLDAVYVGALDARFDWHAVRALAEAYPGWTIRVAGPSARPPGPLPSNVLLLGAVAYEDVPALLARARIGLLPLSDDPSNAGRSPMKLYEYLAAGLAVVTTRTRSLVSRPEVGQFAYASHEEMVAAFARAAAVPPGNPAGRTEARTHGWPHKAQELVEFVGARTSRG